MLLEVNISQHWRRWPLLIMHLVTCQRNLSQKYISNWKVVIFFSPLLAVTCATSPFLSPPDFRQTMALAAAKRRDHQRKLGTAQKKRKEPNQTNKIKKQSVPFLRLVESMSCLSKAQPCTTTTTSAFQSPPCVLTVRSVCCAAQCSEDNKPHPLRYIFTERAHQSHSSQLSLLLRRFIKQPQLGLIATNWHIIFY